MSSLYTLRRVAENSGRCSGKSGTDKSLKVHGDELGNEKDIACDSFQENIQDTVTVRYKSRASSTRSWARVRFLSGRKDGLLEGLSQSAALDTLSKDPLYHGILP